MGLVLATTIGLVIWLVLWALGLKAIDAFMITLVIVWSPRRPRSSRGTCPGTAAELHGGLTRGPRRRCRPAGEW